MSASLRGFLVCDKPAGVTSRDVVNWVQRRMRHDFPTVRKLKVGHTGTLDPLATGVLVIAIGAATRLTDQVHTLAKRYRGTFRLGAFSDSGDIDGEVIEDVSKPIPGAAQLADACKSFTGVIEQVPPAHSAIHIDGVRAYQRVRRGEKVCMPSRTVEIHDLRLIRYEPPRFTIDVRCGGGTYIRTLGIDIAKSAGSVAVMTELVRTSIGDFHLDEALSREQLETAELTQHLRPLVEAFPTDQRLGVDSAEAIELSHGRPIANRWRASGRRAATDENHQVLAVVDCDASNCRPTIVLAPAGQ